MNLSLNEEQLLIKNSAEKFFLDNPNKRSLHIQPVPSAGGLSFIIPLILYDLIFSYLNNFEGSVSLSFLCIPLILISFLDDLIRVSPKGLYLRVKESR